jgi:hypothetical protein
MLSAITFRSGMTTQEDMTHLLGSDENSQTRIAGVKIRRHPYVDNHNKHSG